MKKYLWMMFVCAVAALLGSSSVVMASSTTLTFNHSSSAAGEYSMTVSNSTVSGLSNGPLSAVCDDYNNQISRGESWTLGVETLQDIINAGSPAFNAGQMFTTNTQGLATPVQAYEAAMWLTGQIMDESSSDSGTYGSWTDLNWALWALFSSNAETTYHHVNGTNYRSDTQAQTDLAYVVNAVTTGTITASDFTNYLILTPDPLEQDCKTWWGHTTCSVQPQEFITRTPGTTTPEPATLVLFGTALVGLGLVSKRWRGAKACRA